MKLLWTISNWKRTGPLEPSLDLAAAIGQRGHDVRVAVGRAPEGEADNADVAAHLRDLTPAGTGATLAKHSAPIRDWRDARRLRRWIRREAPAAVVATQRTDHMLALRAVQGTAVPVVRLWFGDGLEEPDRRDLRALRRGAGALVFSKHAAEQLRALGVAAERVVEAAPPLDVRALRARAARGDDRASVREALGIPPEALLVGIVARMQRHRRFEMLWEAVAAWRRAGVAAHVLAVGRGTYELQVAREPVRAAGLGELVTFAGYLRGVEYAQTLAALDAQLLLVPGSDPTCRALREGMALGVPSIASRRGMLPEIVDDGVTGLLIDDSAESLAAAVTQLAAQRNEARALGAAAAARADAAFATPVVAEALEALLTQALV